jgi:peptidoglycan/LPS O-acetylase OafA/YrhL
MKVSNETSQKIKNMSLLCAVLVVGIHVTWPHEQALSVGWLMDEVVATGISNIAVPFFFVVSGFFLAKHFDEKDWYRRETAKRIKTLLVPFAIWSVLSLLISVPLNIVADKIAHRPFGASIYLLQDPDWLRILGLNLMAFPLYGPLWYVRCIFFFVLTAPLFKRGVEKYGYAWFAAAFAVNLLSNHIPIQSVRNFLTWVFSTSGLFYFSVGIFMQRFPVKPQAPRSIVLCGIVGFGLVALKAALAYSACRFEAAVGKLSLPFLLYFMWGVMPTFRLPQWLTSCSFPIYLMHSILIPYINSAMKHTSFGTTSTAFIAWGGSLVASIAATVVLRRFFPPFANLIFGGR